MIMCDLYHRSFRGVSAEAVCLCVYLRELRERSDVVLRVSDALDVDSLRLIVDGSGEIRGVVAVDELHGDAETLQKDCEKLAKPT